MCIILSGENEPDTTKLFSIPVIIENGMKSTLSLYINNFDLRVDGLIDGYSLPSMLKNPTTSGMYYNAWGELVGFPTKEIAQTQSYGSNINPGSIMIVPYPIERNVENPIIGLVNASTDKMKSLRRQIINLKPIKRNFSKSLNSDSYSTTFSARPLEVYEVGNYKISVALGFSDLESRLDWIKFTKPADFNVRINTLVNPKLYSPEYKWFYVVAEAIKNIKDDGFGVVYPRLSSDYIYFPTAHEQRSNNSTNTDYNFDYECYGYSLREKPDAQYTLTLNRSKENDYAIKPFFVNADKNITFENDLILKPLELLKNLSFIDLNKNKLRLNPDPHVAYLSIITKDGKDDNHNWFL